MFHSRPYPFELTPIGKIWTLDREQDMPVTYPDYERPYTIEIDAVFFEGSVGLDTASHLTILYWLSRADRSVLKSKQPDSNIEHGVFSTFSRDRPNPIGLGEAKIQRIEKNLIFVRGNLGCPSGTALLDLRPLSCPEVSRDHTVN